MNAFLWTMVGLLALGVLGKSCQLYMQDTVRNLAFLPWDILINIGLIAWAVWLLATHSS
jgi:hypothetical protein